MKTKMTAESNLIESQSVWEPSANPIEKNCTDEMNDYRESKMKNTEITGMERTRVTDGGNAHAKGTFFLICLGIIISGGAVSGVLNVFAENTFTYSEICMNAFIIFPMFGAIICMLSFLVFPLFRAIQAVAMWAIHHHKYHSVKSEPHHSIQHFLEKIYLMGHRRKHA